jgi:hypothetical protein
VRLVTKSSESMADERGLERMTSLRRVLSILIDTFKF